MFGLLTVLALQIGVSGAGKTDPVISAADFGAYFDAARKGKLEIPSEAPRKPSAINTSLSVDFITSGCPDTSPRTPKSFERRGFSSRRFTSSIRALKKPLPEIHVSCASGSRRSPVKAPRSWW